jgi:hypothetical protein
MVSETVQASAAASASSNLNPAVDRSRPHARFRHTYASAEGWLPAQQVGPLPAICTGGQATVP